MSGTYNGSDIYNDGAGSGGGLIDNPIVDSGFAIESLKLAACDGGAVISNATNTGSFVATLTLSNLAFVCRALSCFCTQLSGSGNYVMFIANTARQIIAKTSAFSLTKTGQHFENITQVWNASTSSFEAGSKITLSANDNYYLGLFCPQINAGAMFESNSKSVNGVWPWIGYCGDNLHDALPDVLPAGFEVTQRVYMSATTDAAE